MGRMIRKWTEWRTRALSALMGVLGFGTLSMMNGCMEYGCPMRDFSYSGRVLTETGEPIEGVRVVLAQAELRADCDSVDVDSGGVGTDDAFCWVGMDTMWSDGDGRFRSEVYESVLEVDKDVYVFFPLCAILLDDVDGAENGGEFESDTVEMSDMEEVRIKDGDGDMYEGEYEYTFEKRLREKEKSGE